MIRHVYLTESSATSAESAFGMSFCEPCFVYVQPVSDDQLSIFSKSSRLRSDDSDGLWLSNFWRELEACPYVRRVIIVPARAHVTDPHCNMLKRATHGWTGAPMMVAKVVSKARDLVPVLTDWSRRSKCPVRWLYVGMDYSESLLSESWPMHRSMIRIHLAHDQCLSIDALQTFMRRQPFVLVNSIYGKRFKETMARHGFVHILRQFSMPFLFRRHR